MIYCNDKTNPLPLCNIEMRVEYVRGNIKANKKQWDRGAKKVQIPTQG